ncbi:HAMP domain-containing histidine kinase [Alphaproteobacteria bacterium]|nr:HAMP domain-containing histidine kinase [Alphaproteobacteria bacterium]
MAIRFLQNDFLSSLTGRITFVTVIGIGLSAAAVILSFLWIFETTLDEQLDNHLTAYNDLIVGAIEETDGKLVLQNDRQLWQEIPRFWQVDFSGERSEKSGNFSGRFPQHERSKTGRFEFVDDSGTTIIAYRQEFNFPNEQIVWIAFGLEQQIAEAYKTRLRKTFQKKLLIALGLICLVLLITAIIIIAVVRSPLRSVSLALEKVQSGDANRIEGVYPKEIAFLSWQVNDLLASSEENSARQREFSANIAHAIKTPLTVIRNDSANEDTKRHVDELLQLVDRSLVRSNIRATTTGITSRIEIAPIVARISAGFQRIYTCEIDYSNCDKSCFNGDEADLFEVLGNLIENACKFGRYKVRVTVEDGMVVIEDDGDGVEPDRYNDILLRSVRLDETVSGTGLGLAVTQEIVSTYKGQLAFGRSELGGLKVTVHFAPKSGF